MSTNITEMKRETTLQNIALDVMNTHHGNVFAVIIDVSEPKKGEKTTNYNTKLKVIDPTFNYKQELKTDRLKFHKFVHINIYSERPEDAPKVKNVGDIIRLRRFKFKYTEKGELMGNDVKFSNWLIYPALHENKDVSISYKDFDKNKNRPLNSDEVVRVSGIRTWSEKFFGENSLMYISWWCGFKDLDEKGASKLASVDLILKVKGVETGKKSKITFVDRENKTFDLALKEKPTLKIGNIIKLRCVDVNITRDKEINRAINLTLNSSCMFIPGFSSDAKQFEKSVQDQKKSPAKATKTLDPFINDYQVEESGVGKSSKSTPKKGPKGKEEKWVTAVKKIYNTKKVTTGEELQKNLKNVSQNHGSKFLVKGHIQDFSTTDPEELIKFTNIVDKRTFNYGEKLDQPKKIRAFYNFIVMFKDDSLEEGQAVPIYILTGEYNSHLFSNWKMLPEQDEILAWQNLKKTKLSEFHKKLESVKGSDNSARFVLELKVTKKGKPFYQLVDTIFLA